MVIWCSEETTFSLIQSSKEQHLLENVNIFNILDVFTDTFDKFNACLLIKSIKGILHFFGK